MKNGRLAVAQSRPAQIMYDPLFCRRERPLQGPRGAAQGISRPMVRRSRYVPFVPSVPPPQAPQAPKKSQEPWRNLAVFCLCFLVVSSCPNSIVFPLDIFHSMSHLGFVFLPCFPPLPFFVSRRLTW